MARTRAHDYDDKKRAILHSAARLFAEHGYDRASMNQIAEACGVSKPLLYHYYNAKDALLFDMLRTHLEELVVAVQSAELLDDPPETRLYAMIAALLDAYRDADAEHKVQINDLKRLPLERQEELRFLERKLVARFSDVVRAINPRLADARGQLKPVVMSLFGALNWHYMWFRPDGPVTREAYAKLATRLFVNGIRAFE
ncbi:MAG: TetR/AcrR family transcriptional regulator [Pseudomonadota bacterium]